jgi:hypothetical protein
MAGDSVEAEDLTGTFWAGTFNEGMLLSRMFLSPILFESFPVSRHTASATL